MVSGIGITSNADSVMAKLKKIDRKVDKAITDSLDQAARQGVRMAKRIVRKKTGALSASIDMKRSGKYSREIGFGKKYGIWIEKGRGEVLPKNKKALFWKGLSHPVMRAGPAKAYPFMKPTAEYLDKAYPLLLKSKVHDALN